MTLFDYYLRYMQELFEGQRQPPEGITLTAVEENERMRELSEQLSRLGVSAFVRACAAQDGTALDESLFTENADPASLFAEMMRAEAPAKTPAAEDPSADDPDRGKHPFEVLLDCVALDDELMQYFIEVLKKDDRKEFFKISRICTKLDLDPHEFLYWLGHREDFGTEEERTCAAVMDGCMRRLIAEKRLDVLAALLSGDQKTFESFRCEAPELMHLREATFDWYSRNYLDRDYPIRILMQFRGVVFPDHKE